RGKKRRGDYKRRMGRGSMKGYKKRGGEQLHVHQPLTSFMSPSQPKPHRPLHTHLCTHLYTLKHTHTYTQKHTHTHTHTHTVTFMCRYTHLITHSRHKYTHTHTHT